MIYETCMGDVHDLAGCTAVTVRPIPPQLAQALRAPRATFAMVLEYANGKNTAVEPFSTEASAQIAVKSLSEELFNRRMVSAATPPADILVPGPRPIPPMGGKN